jgi:cell division protein FtsZ
MPARRMPPAGARGKLQGAAAAAAAATRADPPITQTAASGTKATTDATFGSDRSSEAKHVHLQKPSQEEFGFGEMESRGHFEKTDRNLFDGQDLDVPTYLRRGIKISL